VSNTAQVSASSTDAAADVGDHRWRELLGQFERLVAHDLGRRGAHSRSSTGDGVVATFDVRVTARVTAHEQPGAVSLALGSGPEWQDRDVQVLPIEDLSDRELGVLALVAEGRSNQQIAASLYLSVRTVERHLSNIYVKLRVSGKAARAAAAARFSGSGRAPARLSR